MPPFGAHCGASGFSGKRHNGAHIDPYPNTKIVSHLLPRKPTGQRDPHRVLTEFIYPFQFLSQNPVLQ